MSLFYRLQRKTCFDYISQLSSSLPGSARHTPPPIGLTAGGRSQGHSHGLKRVTHTAANLARNFGGLQVAEDLVSSRGSLIRQRVYAATQVRGRASTTTPPVPVWYLQTRRLQAQSLQRKPVCLLYKVVFLLLKPRDVSFSRFSLPTSLPQIPPSPTRVCSRDSTGSCPTLTGSWGGGTRGVKSQSKPASSFLTFAPDSQRQP